MAQKLLFCMQFLYLHLISGLVTSPNSLKSCLIISSLVLGGKPATYKLLLAVPLPNRLDTLDSMAMALWQRGASGGC